MKLQLTAAPFLLCTLTYPAYAQLDTISPWRVQVRVHTCNVSDAGTDSKVFVRLTSNHLDRFWLATGRDDRKRGRSDTYDVWIREPMPGVSTTVGSITEVTLGIHGADKWCFDRVELFINNPHPGDISATTAFAHRIFDSGTITGGIWISTADRGDARVLGSQVTVASNTASTPPLFRLLRGTQWNLSATRAAILRCPRVDGLVGVERGVLEQMFESFLGHLMGPDEMLSGYRYGDRVGRAHLAVTRESDNRIRVDADIVPEDRRDRATYVWDLEVVFEFSCMGGTLTITPVSVDVDSRRWLDWLSLGLTRVFARLAERIDFSRFGSISVALPACFTTRITADGDLTFLGTGGFTCCYVPCP